MCQTASLSQGPRPSALPPGQGTAIRNQTECLLQPTRHREQSIAGYTLPQNSLVQMFPYVCQHDPRWFPDPETFDPDRFLPDRQPPPFAYFPFGGGPRICIGNTFSMMEMTLVAATLLQHLKVDLAPGQKEPQPVPLMSLRPIVFGALIASGR